MRLPFGKEDFLKTACAVLFARRTAFLYSCFTTHRWKGECLGNGTAFSSSLRKTGGRVWFDTEKDGGFRTALLAGAPVRGAAVPTPAEIRKELETG